MVFFKTPTQLSESGVKVKGGMGAGGLQPPIKSKFMKQDLLDTIV